MTLPSRRVFADPPEMARAAAERVADLLRRRGTDRKPLSLVLAGGRSADLFNRFFFNPRRFPSVPWGKIHLFWGDERCVPHRDPSSNAGAARRVLGPRGPVPGRRQYPFFLKPGDPRRDAGRFESRLRRWFRNRRPDVVLLGMGEDGHTASLFPGFPALSEKRRWVAFVENAPKPPPSRLTLTLPFFNRARHVIFLVQGPGKQRALRRVWRARGNTLPAGRVRPARGSLEWYVTREALRKG